MKAEVDFNNEREKCTDERERKNRDMQENERNFSQDRETLIAGGTGDGLDTGK